ncbi:phage terminase small subunit P27 family [Levilactobacillus brevis]
MVKKRDLDVNDGHLRIDPPDYLGRQAKVTWRKIIPFLEEQSSVRRIDSGLVEMYVSQYGIYRDAYKHIQENGQVTPIYKHLQNSAGEIVGKDFIGYKRNPSTQIYDSAIKNLAKIGAELGLPPKSRADLIKIAEPDDGEGKKDAGNSVKRYLGGGN